MAGSAGGGRACRQRLSEREAVCLEGGPESRPYTACAQKGWWIKLLAGKSGSAFTSCSIWILSLRTFLLKQFYHIAFRSHGVPAPGEHLPFVPLGLWFAVT